MKRAVFVLLCLTLVSSVWSFEVKVARVERIETESFLGYMPNRIIIQFNHDLIDQFDRTILQRGRTGVFSIDALGEKYKAIRIRQQFRTARRGDRIDLSGFYKIDFANELNIEAVVEEYRALSGVIKVQPVGVHAVDVVPNDSQFYLQWHLDRAINDADIDAPEAWDFEKGDDAVIVAVLDTGVRYYHKDLGGVDASPDNIMATDGNIWINTVEKNNMDGLDNDGNGFVDDWVGWDFVDGTFYPPASGEDIGPQDNDPRDFNGHGTHCAGNVAAMNNNGGGVCGIAGGWGTGTGQATGNGVKIMCLRMGYELRRGGQGIVLMDAAAEAMIYAADNGAKIVSCSWGSSDSGGMADAADYFLATGGLIFHAAGNSGADDPDYLDLRGDCISVAATDSNDVPADFTNYGDWVDISAPGTVIWSTYHNKDDEEFDYIAGLGGTSMSTPIAAGCAALVWSQHPSWTAAQVAQQLYDTADPVQGLSLAKGNGVSAAGPGEMGAGRVNAGAAVYFPIAVELTNFAARMQNGIVLIEWTTESESRAAGFYIQRSLSQYEGFSRLHDQIIVAKGNVAHGASYQFFDEHCPGNNCYYRLEEVRLDGSSSFCEPTLVSSTTSADDNFTVPFTFALQQNYPNPFNPSTTISYSVPNATDVNLAIYNLNGRLVKQLVAEEQSKGYYAVNWDGTDTSGQQVVSGPFIYRLQAGENTAVRKMVLMR